MLIKFLGFNEWVKVLFKLDDERRESREIQNKTNYMTVKQVETGSYAIE